MLLSKDRFWFILTRLVVVYWFLDRVEKLPIRWKKSHPQTNPVAKVVFFYSSQRVSEESFIDCRLKKETEHDVFVDTFPSKHF